MRLSYAALACLSLSIFPFVGCGDTTTKPSAAASGNQGGSEPATSSVLSDATVVGTWGWDDAIATKIVMAQQQRDTPNKPFAQMETDVRSVLFQKSKSESGFSFDLTPDHKATISQKGNVLGNLTWSLDGDALKLADAKDPSKVLTGKMNEGFLEVSGNGPTPMYLVKTK